jgi:heterodisulfide reductase subunit D
MIDGASFEPNLAEHITSEWEKLFTCMQCGTCSSSCPTAYAMDYTPRQLWQMLRLGMEEEVFNSQTFWLCTACKSCQVRCPRGISLTDAMLALKEYANHKGINIPRGMQMMGETVVQKYNISGDDNATRQIWSDNLPQTLWGVRPRRRQAEVVYFLGCVSSFYPRVYSIPQDMVRLLDRGAVEFTTLGENEWCCGYPLYVAGMRDRMAELIRHNVQQVRRVGARRVVFSCPSCYYAWTHLYPEVVDVSAFELQHAAEFLDELLDEEPFPLGPVEEVVTYHDPCDLGRKSGVYAAPRRVLARIPDLELREMAACGEDAQCCGGGGDVEIADPAVTSGAAGRRLVQVQATGARTVVSACQQCKRTFQDGARRNKIRVRAADLIEILWRAASAAPEEE